MKYPWVKKPGALLKPKILLVWDMFRAHCCDSVKARLKEYRTRQAVIPGGCTSVLQPLDVSVNKPFKTYIRKLWMSWMISGETKFTKVGAMKRPRLSLVVKWVKEAWDRIPEELIIKSFKKRGISNAMDGTKDGMLYEDLIVSSSGKDDTSVLNEDLVATTCSVTSIDEDESQPTISDYELNDYYDMTNDNSVDLTDQQMMRLYDSEEQFSGLSSEPGHTIA